MLRDARAGRDPWFDPDRYDSWSATSAAIPAASPASLTLVSAPQQAPLVVTTLVDVVDANDGVLSLRESVLAANANPGFDTITFAETLRGDTITLTLGDLVITDDLAIDGDPLNGGAASMTIDGGVLGDALNPYGVPGFTPLRVDNASLFVEDLTIRNSYFAAISATDATLSVNRVDIDFAQTRGGAAGIAMSGGDLTLYNASIGNVNSETAAGLRLSNGADAFIGNSAITNTGGDIVSGIFGIGGGNLTIVDSTIADNFGLQQAIGIRFDGTLTIENSTIADNGARGTHAVGGIAIDGDMTVINSTIAGNWGDRAIDVAAGGTASVVNSTITGTRFQGYFPVDEVQPTKGILVAPGATVSLANTIVDDSVDGTIVSNGANTFRDAAVDGALPGDRLGVEALDLFSTTVNIGSSGLRSGVLADNGGPTRTIALRNDPANPAIDAADPATAPAVDQRGFARDPAPDIGAFEAGAEPPLPIGDEGLIVTTFADEVVVDGEVSLREAVLTANALSGPNTITFADELFGGTITLTQGDLVITDDLEIDGDPLNGGPGAITVNGGVFGDNINQFGLPGFTPFSVTDAALSLEDMTLREASGIAVWGTDADLTLDRVLIDRIVGPQLSPATGIFADGGKLALLDSTISNASAETGIGLQMRNGADAVVANSTITGNGGDIGFGIEGSGRLAVIDSTVAGNGGFDLATGIRFDGTLTIENSTIADNGARNTVNDIGAIAIVGDLSLINSTIAGNWGDRAIDVAADSTARIINSTVTGSFSAGYTGDPDTQLTKGILAAPGATVSLVNTIVDDAVDGAITSNGANTFRDTAVTGAVAGDRLGVDAEQLFALTSEIGTSDVRSGVLADNGGPTQTIALLNDPANPALNAADPADAPPFDQRGFPRDATPDIGAFELGAGQLAPPPLPPLAEKVPLADADILGAPRSLLTLVAGDAAISFADEFAAFQNSLGVYLVGPNGTILNPQWVFERIEHAEPSDLASELARPGGGPLSPGDTVWLSELFDPADLGPGVEFGLFLVTDGWTSNPRAIFEVGSLAFRTGDAATGVTDTTPQLFHIAEDGAERLVLGDIMHTVDAGSANPLSNTLNPGGTGQVTSGTLDGLFTVAFEDKPLAESDRDFNDAIVAIDLLDAGDILFAGPAVAETAAMPAGGAALETLLVTAETV